MKNTTYQKWALILLTLIGVFAASAVFAEEEKSVLDRVKMVEDPELAKLIQIAIDNLPQAKLLELSGKDLADKYQRECEFKITKAKTIRIVTEIYSQIKLLDEKIKQINIRIDGSKTTKDIESELLLAKSTLEAERLTKIAELRETMNWTPWTSFGPKEIKDLNAWIHLDVIDDVIRIFEFKKPFYEGIYNSDFTHLSFYSYDDTIKYLEDIFKRPETEPIRIAMFATKEGSALAEKLEEQIKLIAKNAKADFQTDLADEIRILTNEISSLYIVDEKRIQFENTDFYNTAKLADYIKKRLQRPGAIPRTYYIYYNQIIYKDKVKELEDALNAVIKELGYTKYVKVKNQGQSVEKLTEQNR